VEGRNGGQGGGVEGRGVRKKESVGADSSISASVRCEILSREVSAYHGFI
jgi:hypothetical protein